MPSSGCNLCRIATPATNSSRNLSSRAIGPSRSYLSTSKNKTAPTKAITNASTKAVLSTCEAAVPATLDARGRSPMCRQSSRPIVRRRSRGSLPRLHLTHPSAEPRRAGNRRAGHLSTVQGGGKLRSAGRPQATRAYDHFLSPSRSLLVAF
jgi:hypothetical protein